MESNFYLYRLETDDAGPQDELEYWKSRAARLTLLVEQINTHPCKMTLVTLRAAQSKLLKVGAKLDGNTDLWSPGQPTSIQLCESGNWSANQPYFFVFMFLS